MVVANNSVNPYANYLALNEAPKTNKGLSAGESRANAIQMESVYGIPQGLYQAVIENKTGWRMEQPLLPAHRQAEEDHNREMAMRQAAERLVQKYREFDGIAPLAIDAYYRGDKATRASINGEGFPQTAVDNVYKTMARLPKFGGEGLSDADSQALSAVMGQPSADFKSLAESPSPKPVQAVKLQRRQDGSYFTGDTFLDAVLMIESNGDTNAVSPTGATGLFQFTKGTGRRYGLFGKNGEDYRKNPEMNLAAMQRLTADNARYLASKGVEVTPATLYLAHNQGAGGAVEILRAAQGKGDVSPAVRKNMDLNNGRGKTPAQFYAMFADKMQNNMEKLSAGKPMRSSFAQEISQYQASNPQPQTQQTEQRPQRNHTAQAERQAQDNGDLAQHRAIHNKALIENLFSLDPDVKHQVPDNIKEAMRGILAGIA